MKKKWNRILPIFMAVAVICMPQTNITYAASKTATVYTQAELNSALSNSSITKINLKTSSTKTFEIKKGTYTTKALVVNAPKASVVNSGAFKTISITAIGTSWKEQGAKNSITVSDTNANITIVSEKETQLLDVKSTGTVTLNVKGTLDGVTLSSKGSLKLVAGGTVNAVTVNAAGAINISGTSTAMIPMTVSADGLGSSVKISSKAINIDLGNYTSSDLTANTVAGKMVVGVRETATISGTSTIPDLTNTKEYSLNLNDYASAWTRLSNIEQVELHGSDIFHLDQPTYVDVDCYALKNVVYCATPKDATVEVMNIYVPTQYLKKNADGTYSINTKGTCNGYTAETAPIIYQNTINGYEEGAAVPIGCNRGPGVGYYYDFINAGYVVVGVGTLGKGSTVTNSDGTTAYIGRAPMPIVDLKAGVSFLKLNASILPGDANKIFAGGASAGGAMAALLGATGNSSDYDSYLKEIGAADATNDIYGVLDFCPITNLDNADAAYEWLHTAQQVYKAGWETNAKTVKFSNLQKAVSNELVSKFVTYINGLGIKNTLDASDSTGRTGAFYDNLVKVYSKCLTDYINEYQTDGASYVKSLAGNSNNEYASWDSVTKTATITDYDTFEINIMPRAKSVPASDSLESANAENGIFGNESGVSMHFSTTILNILKNLSSSSDSEVATQAASYVSKYQSDLTVEQLQRVYIMNPLNYMGTDEVCTTAPNWRFRIGTADQDIGAVMAYTMEQVLTEKESNINADFNVVWGKGHMQADYSVTDVIDYINNICKN